MLKTAKAQILGTALAITVCLTLGAGCAKIGEPQPPRVHVPKPAVDLAVHQLSDLIVLMVAKPSLNTDGSAATTLASVDVFRLNENMSPSVSVDPIPEEQYAKRAERILSIPSSGFSTYLRGDSFVIQDKLDLADRSTIYSYAYRYAVLFINKKNQTAGFSNQVLITPVAIPPPPSGLSARVAENLIRLEWVEPAENMDKSTPPRIAGYKVYRAEGSGEFGAAPIHPDLVQKSSFEDRNFQFDKLYRYRIKTVGSARNPYAESLDSQILTVEARDVFPPAPPENFNAIREGNAIILLWAPSSSPDVAGYRIYRQDKKAATRHLIQKDLIAVLNYRDSPVESGQQFEYEIRAVDSHGNESAAVQAGVDTR
jgi:hypothetical protein